MNEIEIALWSLCVESNTNTELDQSTILLVTACQIKVNLIKYPRII